MNASFPIFLLVSADNRDLIEELIKGGLRMEMEKSQFLFGNEEEKFRHLGTILVYSFRTLLNSGVQTVRIKDIFTKMIERALNSQNIQARSSNISLIVDAITWIEDIPIDMTTVKNLLQVSEPMRLMLSNPQKDDMLRLALLNALTQVTVSSFCKVELHILWTVTFGYVLFGVFMEAYEKVVQSIVDTNSASSSTSTPTSTRTCRARGRFPTEVTTVLDQVFEARDGNVTIEDRQYLAKHFQEHITLAQVNIYFKNMRAKRKRLTTNSSTTQ